MKMNYRIYYRPLIYSLRIPIVSLSLFFIHYLHLPHFLFRWKAIIIHKYCINLQSKVSPSIHIGHSKVSRVIPSSIPYDMLHKYS